jgi:hypothetical protein
MKFRKKPVVIDAIQYDGDWKTVETIIKKFETNRPITWHPDGKNYMEIETLEGVMRANVGDWIIRGVRGEIYPCKPDIFADTYEAVDKEEVD